MASRRPRGEGPRLVTLSSDVGWAYAAQMKGVLSRSLSMGRVIDLTHELPPHGVEEAAFVVRAMTTPFPAGTVHVVVVDPGVGGERAAVVVGCADGTRLVGPDNGVLMPAAHAFGRPEGFRLDPRHFGPSDRVGTTFDGRDLFAPAAARLAAGVAPSALGAPHALRELALPSAAVRHDGAEGRVVHVDRFGSLISNVPGTWAPRAAAKVGLRFGRGKSRTVVWATSYEGIGTGRTGALVSSFGTIEIAVGRGDAARRHRVGAGTQLRLTWGRPASTDATETVNSGRRLPPERR